LLIQVSRPGGKVPNRRFQVEIQPAFPERVAARRDASLQPLIPDVDLPPAQSPVDEVAERWNLAVTARRCARGPAMSRSMIHALQPGRTAECLEQVRDQRVDDGMRPNLIARGAPAEFKVDHDGFASITG